VQGRAEVDGVQAARRRQRDCPGQYPDALAARRAVMACAVSVCVCSASIVMTARARLVNASSRSRTAGISFDFAVMATCPEDRADAVRQRRDQVRGFPGLVFGAADGLAVDRDHQPAADLHGTRRYSLIRPPTRAFFRTRYCSRSTGSASGCSGAAESSDR
jgi:hypothetical protein